MAQILKFIPRDIAFDPDSAAVLVAAYDKALSEVDGNGQPDIVRELIAKRIIELAADGERDPERLCTIALTGLGLPH